jgi:hypothetical protein
MSDGTAGTTSKVENLTQKLVAPGVASWFPVTRSPLMTKGDADTGTPSDLSAGGRGSLSQARANREGAKKPQPRHSTCAPARWGLGQS